MGVYNKYTMPAMSNIIVIIHRPNYNTPMERLQAFKFELQPSGEQQRQMRRFSGACRFVFNKALALQKQNHENSGKFIGYVSMAAQLVQWKKDPNLAWLNQAPSQPLQQALKDLDRAYTNFFAKRADFPKFKKRGQHDSFRYPEPKQIKLEQGNRRILLPKLGWVRYRNSRDVVGDVRNATVSQSGGKWFVSIQTRQEVEVPAHLAASIVGIDMGIVRFATLSDGTVYEPLNSLKKNALLLAHRQRELSRKDKFSHNWGKAKTKVQRLHHTISNARRDYLHKTSTLISKNHAVIVMEDLRTSNMSRSARGTVEAPGKQVKAKSGLNKAILDQGWGEFRRQLEYKQAWRGGEVIAVPPMNTSRRCPACWHTSKDNRKTQANFACVECGFEENADLVGAFNVLAAGHAVLACGEAVQLGPSVKQEPTEAIQAAA